MTKTPRTRLTLDALLREARSGDRGLANIFAPAALRRVDEMFPDQPELRAIVQDAMPGRYGRPLEAKNRNKPPLHDEHWKIGLAVFLEKKALGMNVPRPEVEKMVKKYTDADPRLRNTHDHIIRQFIEKPQERGYWEYFERLPRK